MKIIFVFIFLINSVYCQANKILSYNSRNSIIGMSALKAMSVEDLRLLRNKIYYEHGYNFSSPDLEKIINSVTDNNRKDLLSRSLNSVEETNIRNIKATEDSIGLKITHVWENNLGTHEDLRTIRYDSLDYDQIIRLEKNKYQSRFEIFSLENENWKSAEIIPIQSDIEDWAIGDLNGDGRDEICISYSDVLCIIQHSDSTEKKLLLKLPDKIWKILIGDINNDGINEILVWGFPKEYDKTVAFIPLIFRIYQLNNAKLRLVLKDDGKINFIYNLAVPPFDPLFIGKSFRKEGNQLVIKSEQSDVSPSDYITYYWGNGELNEGYHFYYSRDSLIMRSTNRVEDNPLIIGKIDQLNIHNYSFGGLVLIDMENWQYSLFRIKEEGITKRINLFSGHGLSWYDYCTISGNYDKKQKSFLVITDEWIKMFN